MTQRTRYFLVGSALVVVAGVCAGLVAFYSGSSSQGASTSGPAELTYLPSDVTAVAYADVRRIMDSEFRQRLTAVLPTGEAKDRLLEETGIDFERDIDSAVAGIGPIGGEAGGPVVLVRGRFDADQVEALAAQHGAATEQYQGAQILVLEDESRRDSGSDDDVSADRVAGLAFLESDLVALGSVVAIRRAIDASQGGDNATGSVDLMESVGDVADTADAWVVGRFDAIADHPRFPYAVREQLSAVQWFALTANVDRAVTCRLRAAARDAESGEQIRAVVNGAIAMARMAADRDSRFSGVLDSMQATGTGEELDLSFTLPLEILDLVPGSMGPQARISR